MTKIIIDDIEIEVTKKNIKNIRLSVHPPNGEVKVSVPKRMKDESIRLFVLSRLSWINKQRLRFENQEKIPAMEYISGENHYYFGQRYLLNVIYGSTNKSKVKIRNDGYIDLHVKIGSNKEKKEKAIKEWYRKRLKDSIPPIIEKWEKRMNLIVNDWGVKQMKTRWGTCNINAKRIWINLELAKKPPHCLEYIVVHEMAHLIEPRHGERFKAIMDQYYPEWRNIKAELNLSNSP